MSQPFYKSHFHFVSYICSLQYVIFLVFPHIMCYVVKQLESGQYYADLGGSVYKMELARKGEGKHGGFRTIVVFKNEYRTFFIFGYPKSRMSNISDKDLRAHKTGAKDYLSFTDEQLNRLIKGKFILEIFEEETK